jgi:hypothetical protein
MKSHDVEADLFVSRLVYNFLKLLTGFKNNIDKKNHEL